MRERERERESVRERERESRNARKSSIPELDGKRSSGIPRRRRDDNNKMGIKELMWENVDWIYLAQDGVKSLAVMEREKNLQVHFTTRAVYFLSENVLTFKRYIARRRFVVTCTDYTKKYLAVVRLRLQFRYLCLT
jgi:hypothetical protein